VKTGPCVVAVALVFVFLTTSAADVGVEKGEMADSSFTLNETILADSGETVEIFRDNWSIPHVFANTSAGAFFGLGYATAEDRMFQMEYSRRIIQGRISEIVGEEGIESDKVWRTLGWYEVAKKMEMSLDLETRRLLRAYADGVNTYLTENSLLYLFNAYGIEPEPWAVADCIACWFRLAKFTGTLDANEVANFYKFEKLVQELGWDQAIQQMSQPPIVDESGAIVRQEDMDPGLIAEIEQYAADHGYSQYGTGLYLSGIDVPKCSHAWVIGGNRTSTGSAILHSDPQITITAPPLWYEFHICGGDFNCRGIGVAGSPAMLVGWNQNVSWGVTASGADEYDLFKLDINPSNPNQYQYDGIYRDMEIRQETITYRAGGSIILTCRQTVWGPVVTSLIPDVRLGDEFALKHAEVFDHSKCSLQAEIRMMKAYSWESFEEAIENYTAPVVHLIYGDKMGNIGYCFMANVPMRSRRSPLAGKIAQYGNSSEFDWQEIIPKRYLPHSFNPSTGVLSTANNMPVGSWYPLSLGVGTGGTGDSVRSWRLRERLSMQSTFSQEDVLGVHTDTVSPAARDITRLGRHITYVLGLNLSQEAMHALEALGPWNGECNATESNYPLVQNFYLFFRRSVTPLTLIYGGGEAGLCYFLKTVDNKLNQNASYVPTTDEKNYVDLSLRTTWTNTVNLYGSNSSEWLMKFDKTIFISYESNLEGFGSLDPTKDFVSPELQCLNLGTILSQTGNSYSQDVRFDNIDLSKSVMPPGASENSSSPFFDDQIPIWAKGELHEAPLSRQSIENMTTSLTLIKWEPLTTDINLDGKVDMKDIGTVAKYFGQTTPPAPPYCDLAGLIVGVPDGKIDMRDIGLVARHFGDHYP